MFLFFVVLISCWVVAAMLMAEYTSVGTAVFIAVITFIMCGFGSDGAAALLSASSLKRAAEDESTTHSTVDRDQRRLCITA